MFDDNLGILLYEDVLLNHRCFRNKNSTLMVYDTDMVGIIYCDIVFLRHSLYRPSQMTGICGYLHLICSEPTVSCRLLFLEIHIHATLTMHADSRESTSIYILYCRTPVLGRSYGNQDHIRYLNLMYSN